MLTKGWFSTEVTGTQAVFENSVASSLRPKKYSQSTTEKGVRLSHARNKFLGKTSVLVIKESFDRNLK